MVLCIALLALLSVTFAAVDDPIHIANAGCSAVLTTVPGQTIYRIQCLLTTCSSGVVGSNPYTLTSPICAAARHARVLVNASQIITVVTTSAVSFSASTSSGVVSSASGSAAAAFRVHSTISSCREGFLCDRPETPCPYGTYAPQCAIPGYQCNLAGQAGSSVAHAFRCHVGNCSSTCLPCPAGSRCKLGVKEDCPVGQYGIGTDDCFLCLPGSVATTVGSQNCSCCPAGYQSGHMRAKCQPCYFNEVSDGECDRCRSCPNSTYCPCLLFPCSNGRRCVNTPRTTYGFTCALCPDGFENSGGDCIDANECSQNPCPSASTCSNSFGSFTCVCSLGTTGSFVGTGSDGIAAAARFSCVDVNECLVNNGGCHVQRTCANSFGSFQCGPCASSGGYEFATDGQFGCARILPIYSLAGTVVDAVSYVALSGAVVSMPALGFQVTTGSSGTFVINGIPQSSSVYTLQVTRSGYLATSRDVLISANGTNVNLALSRTLNPGQFRFVLSWIEQPQISTCSDLDSHIYSTFCHAYYARASCSSNGHSITLDRDDTQWGGPETMTVTESNGATSVYNHYVYIYNDPASFVGSMAQVSFFTERGLNMTISVEAGPTTVPGVRSNWRFWHTFSLNTATGAVNVVNRITCDTSLSTGSTGRVGENGNRNC
eukprot:m.450060 g.450060  ORF g.450060 m.450060 type:complete len:658 (+) comp56908_c0_seq3:1313-3286(+)